MRLDSRERVFLALNHEEPDRVPIDYWATPEMTSRLLDRFGFPSSEALLEHFDVDFRYIEGPEYVGTEHIRSDGSKEDHFGVPRKFVSYGDGGISGEYSEVVEYPLERATSVDEIESYPKWPKAEWFDYACVREQARAAKDKGKVVVFMGDRLNRCAQLKPAMYVRGIEQILVDTLSNPEMAKAIFRRITDFYMNYARLTLEAAEGCVDIFFTGDDFGTQTNTFLPVDTWRALLRDGFKRFIDLGHEFDCKVAHHSCGCVEPLIPEFIDCGLDIINPLQPEVANMDFKRIKEKFGEQISFHGGISIQKTMPGGSRQEISAEVRDRVDKLATGGGYLFCTAHNLQIDTPLENVEVLFDAYRKLGRYG